ncbi:hypothetical protein NLJ89_g569 [Agrocybe chaxingu]|uniref:ER transporter 6TM N-terminal domain-containing protein n=1 Tax=Agrocybe chaxingu TaxID=84603 RepID=A0A9W8N1S3_9AGAR|nr:hypothetical protein NLJ89_g569 [Agrocybe chaxingu]
MAEKAPEVAEDEESRGRRPRFPTSESKKSVKIAPDDSSSSLSLTSPPKVVVWLEPAVTAFTSYFGWVGTNWTWSKLKPVVRCAIVGWISTVLFVTPKIEIFMGQASFLILIAAFLSPPSDPFMSVLERESLILFFVSLAWAWVSLGVFFAHLARRVHLPTVTFFEVITGEYIEPAPTVILAVFIFFGSSFFLYIKARQGPGPYIFACIFACICIDISLTTAVLFPFPYYLIGRAIVLPLVFHSALALIGSILIFPSTISALFTTRLTDVLAPLLSTLEHHKTLLSISLNSESAPSTLQAMRTDTKKIEGALVPLAAAARLLKSDLIYARFAPDDFRPLQGMCRRLAGRADGLSVYFGLVDPGRERFPGTAPTSHANTPAPTVPGTPHDMSRIASRTASPERAEAPRKRREKSRGRSQDVARRGADDEGEGSQTPATPPTPWASTPLAMANSRLSASMPVIPSMKATTSSRPGTRPPSIHPSTSYGLPSPLATSSSQQQSHSQFHMPSPKPQHVHHHHHHHNILHSSLVALAKARARKNEFAVGTFESQRYLNLEATTLHDPREEEYTARCVELLNECCTPLLSASQLAITTVSEWLRNVRVGRVSHVVDSTIIKLLGPTAGKKAVERQAKRRKTHEEKLAQLKKVRDELQAALDFFREETRNTPLARHLVLEPYKSAFEDIGPDGFVDEPFISRPHTPSSSTPTPTHDATYNPITQEPREDPKHSDSSYGKRESGYDHDQGYHEERTIPPHRHLFHCYVYQYNLIQISSIAIEMLNEILKLEEQRPWPHCQIWTPLERFRWNPWLVSEGVEQAEDDDPNVIQGLQHVDETSSYSSKNEAFASGDAHDLGLPKKRDPDALPPRNTLEWLLTLVYKFIVALGSGNTIFAIKAGLFTVILCLPTLLKSSAGFAYKNRFVWAIFMGQLTLARFRGDTAFGLTARIVSTFGGGLTGMVMWYISCGSGAGNAYGLAAVCAVCFPFFFFARLYWPVPPMTNIVFFVTTLLVVGYSYQEVHIILPGSPGYGWSVAWRRFVLVTIGVVAAFITSFLPPSTTIRRYHRNLLATTSSELGVIYCDILSFANTKHEHEIQEIISSLIAIRSKITRSADLRTNVIYEFSFRGRWPATRYQKIADLQLAISYSLSHLMSIIEHLEPSWSRAFLRRTRFMDPDFQGDILAVIAMISSSLRNGSPLPQITPCPLLDRFMLQYHGLNVIHKEAEEDYGLPRSLTMETLQDEQYMMFCVGISTAFGIINRLDRLMIAVKEVVGEQYHIHGIGMTTALPSQRPPNLSRLPECIVSMISKTLRSTGIGYLAV